MHWLIRLLALAVLLAPTGALATSGWYKPADAVNRVSQVSRGSVAIYRTDAAADANYALWVGNCTTVTLVVDGSTTSNDTTYKGALYFCGDPANKAAPTLANECKALQWDSDATAGVDTNVLDEAAAGRQNITFTGPIPGYLVADTTADATGTETTAIYLGCAE
jgi:hypothetical protein